ncbi:hypothetical protein G7Y89_g11611 [Cudoniella acicularis]|uniref:FAD-binding domain-containing protein n=1 Tax=Cudoniella acicularis TaxID=354080 RepID=A0A8H4VXV2_9HELO|nr:hypothetical protein G7Y89_g11611 [Cudoniella acicularis]
MPPFRVVVVGAGLAGSLLGNDLVQSDINCDVYEAKEPLSKREGYEIQLGAPALASFKACLTPEQQAAVIAKFGRSGGLVSSAPALFDTHFNMILDLRKFPSYTKSAPINRAVLRDLLRRPLNEAKRLHYHKKFKKYQVVKNPGKTDTIRVIFEDGSEELCDLLISAEGSRSPIGLNNIVLLRDCWRFMAKTSLPLSTLARLPPVVTKGPVGAAKDGMIFFFSVYLPQAQRQEPTQEAPKNDFDSTAKYDEDSASLFWSLAIPAERVPAEGPNAIPDKLAFCVEQIKDWHPHFHEMLQVVGDSYIHAFQPRSTHQPSKNWRTKARAKSSHSSEPGNNHVWLMGDSIHAMLPGRGMGGNQAMNDTADALPLIRGLVDKAAQGKVFFFAACALHVAYVVSLIKTGLGFKPVDDAPEFSD